MSTSDHASFRILVLGDFSGRATRGAHAIDELPRRRIHAVDRDDLEELFTRLGVAVRLPASPGQQPIELGLNELEALHPDRIYDEVGLFEELRKLRRRLDDPRTFAAAAAELGVTPTPPPEAAAPDDLLAATLDATGAGKPVGAAGRGSELVDALLRELVIPHVTPAPDPRRAELVAAVDRTISAEMRRVLHDPGIRAVEAAWRGLEFLVRRLETDASLSIHVLDVTRAELEEDLCSPVDVSLSALWARLVEATVHTPGAAPWSLIVGTDTFHASESDLRLLTRIAELAASAGAPFVAGAHPRLAGLDSLADDVDPRALPTSIGADVARAWESLRASPWAAFVGLALPRLLLRLPFGERGGTVERFEFEELTRPADHDGYLWGCGAFASALALGTQFSRVGWAMKPDATIQIEGLPADVRERDGEMSLQPCAEYLLTDRLAEHLAACGLTVLRSIRGRDAVQSGPVRGLNGAMISGAWS